MLFLHVPKTGGTWATAAMLAAGVPAERPAALPFHANLAEAHAYRDRFTFAFVRHPLDFWRSYWAFRMRDGWDLTNAIDARARSDDFSVFVDLVRERLPGAASALYEQFVGSTPGAIDFIGRHERLADDVVEALRRAGEPLVERLLRAHPAANVSDYARQPALYRRASAERLAHSERVAIGRFYATDPVPEWLLDERDRRVHPSRRLRRGGRRSFQPLSHRR